LSTNARMIDKFKLAFQEEGREILVELESALLELNENRDDKELVGRAFRALHTIKGSGSMFGFDDLAAFTHNLENAFDEVRNARLIVSTELINLSLVALDQMKAMLDQAEVDKGISEGILAKLRLLTGKSEARSNEAAPPPPLAAPAAAAGPIHEWQIRFSPGPDFMRNGANPLLLLKELKHLGSLQIGASVAAIPPINEMDPQRCYISWDMTLKTSAPRETIRDVFIFVEDSCELLIDPISSQDSDSAATSDQERRSGTERRKSDTPDSTSSIRVAAAKLDQFVNLVGELVTVQARLGEIAAHHVDQDVADVSEEIERLTSALRESSMSIRMLPIRATFERFRRLVHDLARDLRKEVELSIEGADTELDKTVIDQLNDPLMHLIRNSMDHGIEQPEARLAAGKPRTATICLSARHSGGNVLISVADDGGGIDAAAVRTRAVEKRLVAVDAQLTETEIFSLILAPGFSTARQITDVSGRGVGMDVVRRSVEALRGTIEIASKPVRGTSVTLRLPLTLAIIDGLLVRVGPAYFVLPLAITVECIELTRQDIEKAHGKHIAYVRGEIIPYIRLREYFSIKSERPEREQIMVVETESGRNGFVVDQVIGNYQTVIKNLGRFYRHVQVASGATILGNGTVALILDPNRLVQEATRTLSIGPRAGSRASRSGPPGEGTPAKAGRQPLPKGAAGTGDNSSAIQ
jgi:two-component system, chemotaxis family, sensor kinase CheA